MNRYHQSAAVFLDRDGLLVEDADARGGRPEAVIPAECVGALRRLQAHARLLMAMDPCGGGPEDGSLSLVERLRREGIDIERVDSRPCAGSASGPFPLEQVARVCGLDPAHCFSVCAGPQETAVQVLGGPAPVRHTCRSLPGIREAADWIINCLAWQHLEEAQPGSLDQASLRLRSGGVVAFPTETVYGLGANVFDPQAVARIFEIKQRPQFDPLIAHVCDPGQLPELVRELPDAARELIEHFWPGPLTLVLPKNDRVPDLVTAGLPTVAVRMPRHPLALELIRQAATPIAAPSANRFGCTSPTCAQHVVDQLADQPDWVLDGGACPVGVESTIVSLVDGELVLLRTGGTAVEEIERVAGRRLRVAGDPARPMAPGQLERHYAPRTRLVLCEAPPADPGRGKAGLLAFGPPASPQPFAAVEILSPCGNLRDAAAHLFAAMHRLDALDLDVIYAERVPDTGLGRAINDRLRRAAHPEGGEPPRRDERIESQAGSTHGPGEK